ncbi:B12-binding domain-containing protein [Mesobacillus subterraneus]|uniref:cobalamin B12-binding domain-containing protein n=1 Tax=Mesobacillus subterraneus TaxID=285983 RepID=UPI00203DAAD0|nr:B12-binding domain-containing protein [Mesobacillus subterraneus]MCM3664840.1 B12-binding domain-containing protein [Mesobacillus subterraneus]MCM3681929.1 B12-binding domain-containing protein [Mesobacillus subterraneus]
MEKGIELSQHLLDGNQEAAWQILDEERKAGKNSLYIYESLVTNAMRHIGYLWETNKITVADEHLATSTCDFLLARYLWQKQRDLDAPSIGKKAMFLCVENEQHYLGLKMSSQLFSEGGWETRFHGPNLPLEYVKKAALDWKPDAICISFSILYHAEHLEPYIKELEKLPNRPAIIVGGRLLDKYEFSRHGSERTLFIKNLEGVKDWLDRHPHGVKSSVGY